MHREITDMIAAIAADGIVTEREIAVLRDLISRHDADPDQVKVLLDAALHTNQTTSGHCQQCGAPVANPQDCNCSFCNAVLPRGIAVSRLIAQGEMSNKDIVIPPQEGHIAPGLLEMLQRGVERCRAKVKSSAGGDSTIKIAKPDIDGWGGISFIWAYWSNARSAPCISAQVRLIDLTGAGDEDWDTFDREWKALQEIRWLRLVRTEDIDDGTVKTYEIEYRDDLRTAAVSMTRILTVLEHYKVGGELPFKESKSSRCFVATAACGTPDHHYVEELRRFRDEVLLPTVAGRRLVAAYERTSPPVAEMIAKSPNARRATRMFVVRPAVGATRILRMSRSGQPHPGRRNDRKEEQ